MTTPTADSERDTIPTMESGRDKDLPAGYEGPNGSHWEMIEVPSGPDTGLDGGHWEQPTGGRARIKRSRLLHMIAYAIEKINSDPKSVK